jgi:2-polyprenyl-3-methyl-5-hydroxy-6-metoxy-1,4-benzoquinol methylase
LKTAPAGMPWWPDLSSRRHEAELMDDPCSDPEGLRRTLRQFPLLNHLVSRSRYLLNRYVLADIRRRGVKTVRMLDVGAGGGDIARYLVRAAKGVAGAVVHVDCCEADPRVAAYARRACVGYPTISILERSVFDLSGAPYDYVFSNHFLHHLSDTELAEFLAVSRRLCSGTLLCNDLERSRLSYTAYRAAAPLLLRRSFAAYDGALSIRRGFLRHELEEVLRRSPWGGHAGHAGFPEYSGNIRVGRLEPGRLFVVARAA